LSRSLVSRIKKLEASLPRKIELYLDDGSVFYHEGPVLHFANEGMRQASAGVGPIVEAARRTVSAKGCGKLWQLIAALADSPRGYVPDET
jgi:hypothetical protein